jgi:phytoene/squalene synthetase
MKLDLVKSDYSSTEEYNEYIYGSADVVGLMCLRFCSRKNAKVWATKREKRLGSAFQKINFLRDLKEDNWRMKYSWSWFEFVWRRSKEFNY